MQEYEFRPVDADPTRTAQCAALLGAVLSPHFDRAFLHWQYAENPVGRAIGFNAYHDGALVAHYATIPLAATIDGRVERGLLSLNTATAAAHQGKRLSSTLAQRTYELGAELGYGFVIGVGNSRSTPMLTQKLGFQLVAPLDVFVGVGAFESSPIPADYAYNPHWTDEAVAWRLRRPASKYVAGAERSGMRDAFATVAKGGMLARLDSVPGRALRRSRLRRACRRCACGSGSTAQGKIAACLRGCRIG